MVEKIAVGLDVGTMNLVCTRSDMPDKVSMMRNVFLKLDKEDFNISEMNDISYVENDEGDVYIIGQDAFRLANIFGHEVSRPMEKGLISQKEIGAIDVLTIMLKNLIGDTSGSDAYCCYSIPAESIDESRSVTYHERVFGSILGSLNLNSTPINEAMAIIYSECMKEKFSGIALSFGAGMCNCAVAYKGIELMKFSTSRSGDWIDKNVAESLGIVKNRVTGVKEKSFDLQMGHLNETNKKTKRILEALQYYYENMISYNIKKITSKFETEIDTEIEESMPIIISGGTSLPQGFLEMFKEQLNKSNLPFEISEIRRAVNPLHAVAQGMLIKSSADIKKM
jgi:actin-like ATPase involved in cell morphogenesis